MKKAGRAPRGIQGARPDELTGATALLAADAGLAVRVPTLRRKIHQLLEAGVKLLVGTDSGIPMSFHSQSTWNELDIWVREMGSSPMEAIRSATYWPAKLMGVEDEVGTVSEGKYADIIAVEGDVLRYINLLGDVDIVIKRGVRYK